jgi:chitodextrinase
MNHQKQNFKKTFLLSILLLFALAGCGGGKDDAAAKKAPETITIPGVATKGPIAGAKVSAYLVEADGKKGVQLGQTVISGADGKYLIEIPLQTGPVMIEVVGGGGASYLSETTGLSVPFGEDELLRAVTVNADNNVSITVSPFTEAAYQKVLQLVMQSPASGIELAIEKGNDAVAVMHKISNILADPVTDVNYTAALRIADKIIQTSPSANTTTLTDLISSAVTANTGSGRTDYSVAASAAASTLSGTPGVSEVIASLITVLQAPITTDAPPTVPAFTASLSTANSVTISWSAAVSSTSNDLRYYIYRNGNSVGVTQSLTYTDSGLQPATEYLYTIKAVDPNSNFSPESPPFRVSTEINTTPPTSPSALQITAISANSVTLSWGISTGEVAIAGYEIYRNDAKLTTVTTNSYVDTTVILGSSYSYKVKALNENNISSAFSTSVGPITITINPPLINGGVTVITDGTIL